ncbi:MAG: DUF5666 domain-containing protein [Acidimicrobiales bacterium]|jgi:hypothetical protein
MDLDPALAQGLSEPAARRAGGPGRGWRSLVLRAAAGTVVVLGLAAGSYGIASAASGHGTAGGTVSLATASSSGSPSKSSPPTSPVLPRLGGPGPIGPFGRWGGRGFGAYDGGGSITGLSATTITVETEFGESLTVTTDSSTTYSEAGKTVARTALANGEQVSFVPAALAPSTSTTAGSTVVKRVVIVLPHVSGKVVTVNGSQVVVAEQDGLYVTVNTSTASYEEAGQSAPSSDVQTGTVVSVTGTLSSDHTEIDATTIDIVLPSVEGRVTGVSGTTITITGFDAKAETVTTGSSTAFLTKAGTKTTIASVAKGDLVEAFGTPGSVGTFAAVTVYVGPAVSALPVLPGGPRLPVPVLPTTGAGLPSTGGFGAFGGYGGPAGWGARGGAFGAGTSSGAISAGASTAL